MFQPGVFNNPTQGTPVYVAYSADTKGYSTDFSNIGPVAGIAWRPNVQSGFLRKILGDPELATINGGFTRSFVRSRFDQFLNVYNGNPGPDDHGHAQHLGLGVSHRARPVNPGRFC
jgi:hypothetical protein